MDNLILFLNSFMSYLLLFLICVAVIIIAVLIGIKLRKNKDAKDALLASKASEEDKAADVTQ